MQEAHRNRLLLVCCIAGAIILATAAVGLARDVYGTEGADYLEGTNKADRIAAKGGNDTVWAKKGPDKIYPQNGRDDVYAGAGWDEIDLVIDDDRTVDTVYCGSGTDTVYFLNEDYVMSDCERGYICEGVKWGCTRTYTPYYGQCDDGKGNDICN